MMLSDAEFNIVVAVYVSFQCLSQSDVAKRTNITFAHCQQCISKLVKLKVLEDKKVDRRRLVSVKNVALAQACLALKNECSKTGL